MRTRSPPSVCEVISGTPWQNALALVRQNEMFAPRIGHAAADLKKLRIADNDNVTDTGIAGFKRGSSSAIDLLARHAETRELAQVIGHRLHSDPQTLTKPFDRADRTILLS